MVRGQLGSVFGFRLIGTTNIPINRWMWGKKKDEIIVHSIVAAKIRRAKKSITIRRIFTKLERIGAV